MIGRRTRLAAVLVSCILLAGCTTQPEAGSGSVNPGDRGLLPVPQNLYTSWTSPDRTSAEAGTAQPAGFVAPPDGVGLSRYYDQSITWNDCDEGFQCATVRAPLDWFEPDGQAITLAMKRRAATTEPYLGVLFINPGGPGGSAQNYVNSFKADQLTQYDIVGMDPRGSGESTPVNCGTFEQTDAYLDADWSPDDESEKQALIDVARDFALQCRAGSGALLDHISTIETVYDFELLRQVMGQEKFNFLGVSYGTYLGAMYAELYPEHTGRLVLDAAVNITENDSISQSDGFELALSKFADWCATASECGLGTSQAAVLSRLTDFLAGLDANPIAVGDRHLTQSHAATGIGLYLYLGTSVYPNLAGVLRVALQGDGSYLLQAADQLNSRGGQLSWSFPAIRCLDAADEGLDQAFADWESAATRAPIFGRYGGASVTCQVWAATPAAQVDFTGADAPPIVVIGATGDSATPYQYSVWMADELASAVLVTRDGVGHGSFSSGNQCVATAVLGYLIDGTVPTDGLNCPD